MYKEKEINNIYKDEIQNSLKRLKQGNNLKSSQYFFDLATEYFNLDKLNSKKIKIAVLGANIPEEVILALGENPHYIIGGSLGSCSWADSYVPRDTDSISESILGFLKNEAITSFKDSLIIVPITCDSMRKIAYMLEDKFNILTIDFPSDKTNKFSYEKWTEEMYKMRFALEKHLNKKMSKQSLIESVEIISKARKLMRKFVEMTKNRADIISKSMVQFILNTYYFTDDINLWSDNLEKMCSEISSIKNKQKYNMKKNPNILVMGSHIYFPNFKIPFLLEDINLDMESCVNIVTQKMILEYDFNMENLSKDKLFEQIVNINYEKDCSQAYVNNKSLLDLVEIIESENNFDGVIYHVIKGQIEYDFELERYEDFFAKKDIPIFRLETDYNYQDIEQLRIRMEAFMEMIQHKLYQSRRVVS
ncbi:MAG: 2-hydroxyacyl-CoA dehydratase family protein [Intestinibacter sp.]